MHINLYLFLAKILPIAYGIMKLQISCVVEDDKVGTDILEEKITEFEDFVSFVRDMGLKHVAVVHTLLWFHALVYSIFPLKSLAKHTLRKITSK